MKDVDPTRDIAQSSNFNDWSANELRVGATLLADRTGLMGKGVTYGDLIFGNRSDLIKIIERAKRRKAKKKSTKKSTKKKQK